MKPIPLDEIGRIVSEVIAQATENGANAISMPDHYVAVAHFVSFPEQYAPPAGYEPVAKLRVTEFGSSNNRKRSVSLVPLMQSGELLYFGDGALLYATASK